MKILLIGGSGQLGQELLSWRGNNQFQIFSPSSKELNISNKENLEKFIHHIEPDIVLNFSAYTNVDQAEINYDDCLEVNYESVINLVEILNNSDLPLIHVSTDYVFGKYGEGPYSFDDKLGAINKYGITKLKGENEIKKSSNKAIIIRTASLYGEFGKNYFKTFISLLSDKKELEVISNQKISVTWSKDLVKVIFELLNNIKNTKEWKNHKGVEILHLVNEGYTSWYEVAENLANLMNQASKGKFFYQVKPILAKDWHVKTPRPNDSRLKFYGTIQNLCDLKMPDWTDSLRKAFELFVKNN